MSDNKRGHIDRTGDPIATSVLSDEQLLAIHARNTARTPGTWAEMVANTKAFTQEANRDFIGHAPTDITALLAHVEELEDEIIVRNRILLDQMYFDSFENAVRREKELMELKGGRPEEVEETVQHLQRMFGLRRPGDPPPVTGQKS